MKSFKAKILGLILLWLLAPSLALAQVCDVDNDADIDYNDIGQIFAARNQPASGQDDPRDFDGDGTITVNDGRACVLQCTLPRCAIVDPVNNPPVIISTPVLTANVGSLYSYDVDATDPDAGDVLTYSLDLAPAGMTIDTASGLIQWTPAGTQLGDQSVTVRVTDPGSLADTQSFTVNVVDLNQPPVIISTPVLTANVGSLYSYDVDATDPDAGDVLTYSLDLAPAGMTIDTASGLIQWTPSGTQLGDNAVTVRVADPGSLADTQSFTINVEAALPVDVPIIGVGPDPLDFGDVFVGSSANLPLIVVNTGDATLSVSSISSSGAPFDVFPPLSFDLADGAAPRNVDIDFSPTSAGIFNGTITINSNADNEDPVEIAVTGRGVEPTPDLAPDIDTSDSVDFGTLAEGGSVEKLLTISNTGDAPLDVSDVTSDSLDFVVAALPGQSIPFTLDPGNSQNVSIVFTAPSGSADSTVTAQLTISSNDPDESPKNVALSADVTPVVALVNIPILGASVDDVIDDINCGNVTGSVQFAKHSPVFLFDVTLTDQGGASATSPLFSSESSAEVGFMGIDACALDDGILEVSVRLGSFDPFIGTPAVKNTSALPAPILDPLAGASVLTEIEVCGTSRESTTVKIEGGASTVSTQLDALTTNFCLDVPLRPNTENTLIATAIDDLATPPRPSASAPPVKVTHVDPSSIIIAEASSRPLTIEETELLVQNGVIDLDDPTNFNVSMFTIVLTIGQFPVTVSQPVAVPTSAGVSYGSSGGSGWAGGGGGGGVPSAPRPVTGCTSGCSSVVVIKTPTGQTIPGVIIIDGRIKTLKEFFQVTIAIQNTSAGFELSDMQANILLPAGLSPVRAGPGTDVADVNVSGEIDSVVIGDIGPMSTGTGQFIIRGDGIGTHNVDVEFDGFLTGGGLAAPEPVSGSAGTSVQVFGPPTFDVVVRHPSDPAGDDVVAGEIYELIVEITNTSSRPALYTSLELFVGGQAELVDVNGDPIPDSNEIISFGHIPAGRAVSAAFRVRSSLQGEIIACQAIASENISLTVDTGPDGTDCNIANTYPANFEPLPADQPPVVIGINPLNGQPNMPVTISPFATLTPRSSCIVGDTFTNVVEALIDPSDPTKGIQVISADLVDAGTFYLEELDTFGNPVKHIPTDLTVENPPAGGTTIAVLRLGLDVPHNNSQYFLKDNTTYRATLVGGPGGICSEASGAEMLSDFTWTFSTEQTCNVAAPIASMSSPPPTDLTDRPLNQPIVLEFTNRMNPGSFSFIPGDLPGSSFSVYADAVESGGEISGGSPVPGSGVFSNLNRTLTYTPLANYAEDIPVYIRLSDGLRDICGNPLQTPPSGVQLLSFQTIPPDTTAPAVPLVNPVPAFTNLATVQVSGEAEAGSTVTVTGGSLVKTTTASGAGLFSVSVPLNFNLINDFSVQASDASGNDSSTADTDINGDPLTTVHDNVLPQVISVSPANGASDVGRNAVVEVDFDEELKADTINEFNFTLEGSVIPGTLTPVGTTGFSFTPDNLLDYNKTYNIRMRANGVRDLAGNGLSSEFVASFTTLNFPLPVITDLTPNDGVQGTSFAVTFTGSELVTAFEITSDNPGISGAIVSTTDTAVVANITIDALAATGATTLGLTTLGGNLSTAFNVLHKAPIITDIVPDNGDQGATVNAQIQGSGLTDVTNISIDGTGVTVVDLGTGNDALRDVQFVIDPTATANLRTVTVTTPGGSDDGGFTVTEPVLPVLTSVAPDNGEQGTTFSVTFTGTDLADVNAIVSDDPEISGGIVSTSGTSVVANVTVSALATAGSTTISVVTPAGTSNSLAFTVIEALDEITLSPVSLNLQTLETANLNVSIPAPAGVGGQVITLASSDTTVATVPASVVIPQGSSGTSFVVTTQSNAGSATITASAAGFDSDSSQINVSLRGMSFDLLSPFIGVGRSASGNILLDQPAPSGGVTVNLATGNTAVATVDQASVFIPQGSSSASFTFNGIIVGSTPITASASGYVDESVNINVTGTNVINFGLIPDLAPGQNVSLPTSLGEPAPLGGVTINFTSSDPSIATVTPSVFIPEGLQVPAANPQITGNLLGSVQILGLATGFAPDSRIAIVTVDANFSPSSLSLTESTSKNISLLISAPAPVGGLTFNLSTDDNGVATVPATITVGAGQTSVVIPVSGGTVGSTVLRANSPGINEAAATINVTPQPTLTVGSRTIGKDLQTTTSVSLQAAAPPGGLEVTLTSSDPSKLLLSNTSNGAGSASITVQANSGNFSTPSFYVQSLVDTGTETVTATASGYTTGSGSFTSAPSGFWFNAGNFTRDVFASNVSLQVRATRLNPTTLNRAQDQQVRGGLTVNVDMTNSDPSVGTVTADPVVFNGGILAVNTGFDPLSAGTATIAIVQPSGFTEPANVNTSIDATITAPNINFSDVTVGKDLQLGRSISLSNAPPTPVDVTVTVDDPSVALISTNATAVGTNSITFSGVAGTFAGTIFVQGLTEGASTSITIQAAAYNDDVSTITVNPSGFWFNAGNFTRDVFASNVNLQLRSTMLNATTLNRAQDQQVRGGITVNVDLTNSDPAVGTVTADPVVFNGGVLAVNSGFDPLSGGTATIAIVQPSGFTEPANVNTSVVATITAPNINFSDVTVGKDLQLGRSISLSNAPPTPVDVTVTVDDPSVALISTDPSAVGANSITFSGVSSTSVGTIYVQGLTEGASTPVTIQAAAYNDDVSTITVNPSGFWFNAGSFTRDIFAANISLQVRSTMLNATNLRRAQDQQVRGGITVNVDLTNSDDGVGTLTADPVVFNGGVFAVNTGFDPVLAGATTLAIVQPPGFTEPTNVNTSIVATVTAPSINMSDVSVGKDLQLGRSISLSNAPPSPVDVTVTIAAGSVAAISKSRTTGGSSSVTFSNVSGTSVGTIYIQGLALGSTQITVQAPAYNDRVADVSVNPSGFWFNAGNFSISESSVSNRSIQMRATMLNPTTLNRAQDQEIRAGHFVNVDLTNSDDTVGVLTVNPVVFNGGAGIAVNTAFDPLSAGTSTIAIVQPLGFTEPANVNTSIIGTVTSP